MKKVADLIEKLRQVFSENELPSRAIREHLSNQLGIASEKVNKWFKNARYMALKIRKAENRRNLSGNEIAKASNTNLGKDRIDNQARFTANSCLVSSATSKPAFKNLRRMCLRKNQRLMATPQNQRCSRSVDAPPADVIQVGSGIQCKKEMICSRRKSSLKKSKEKIACYENETRGSEQIFVEMKRLFLLEDRIRELNKLLRYMSLNGTCSDEELIMYVPVAEVKEKKYSFDVILSCIYHQCCSGWFVVKKWVVEHYRTRTNERNLFRKHWHFFDMSLFFS